MAIESMLVCVYLRGAADALSLVVPHADDRYYALRPTLGIPRPDDRKAKSEDRVIDLDGQFGLHPGLAKLVSLFRANELAIVHAVGSDDQTRSHFEAQDRMEHAGAKDAPAASGWIARALSNRVADGKTNSRASLAAVAIGTAAPESLRGAGVAVLRSASDYRLGPKEDPDFTAALAAMYALEPHGSLPLDAELASAGKEALTTLEKLRAMPARAPADASYPSNAFGDGLREIALLAHADLGVEVACVDYDGWDSHFVQGSLIDGLAKGLGDGLAAFRADLGERFDDVTVVVMSEFGRRAYENTSLGTDHGRAGCMFVMGGKVRGGRVIAEWPGLDADSLEPPGDLRVTLDFRDVLAEIVALRMGGDASRVFPGFSARTRGLFAAPGEVR